MPPIPPNLQRLIELALPMIERWIDADPRNRELALELGRYLTAAAEDKAKPRSSGSPAPAPPSSSLPAFPPIPPLAPAAATPRAAPAKRSDSVEKMVTEVLVDVFTTKPVEGLVGGLSSPPASAPGVATPAPPPPPPPPTHHHMPGLKPPLPNAPAVNQAAARLADDAQAQHARFLALQRANHHRALIDKCIEAKDTHSAIGHIAKGIAAIEAFLAARGTLQSGEEAREAFDAIQSAIPSKAVVPAAVEQAIERIIARMDAAEELDPVSESLPSAANAKLAGKVAVLIGGDVREDRRAALQSQLGLAELRWIKSTPTNPASKFDAEIKRREVALVLVAIRWVRHHTGYAVADACKKFKKPLVRIPGGLNARVVAHEILEQVGSVL